MAPGAGEWRKSPLEIDAQALAARDRDAGNGVGSALLLPDLRV
ncbi:hypothetical protein [Andreprevotia sp. IGB-42]|nr:hypothetical protein [Andreprevotia sp. IGB-42]